MEQKRTESLLLSEIQVLLAEKRTHFAILRTGLGIITVPLTIIIFLIATADYHNLLGHPWVGKTIIATLVSFSLGGILMALRSASKLKDIDRLILNIEKENKRVAKIVV